ncbi:MAG: DUF2285 domain-containing protein [Gluconacetobacter sp.]
MAKNIILTEAPPEFGSVAPLSLAPWGRVLFDHEDGQRRVIGLDDPTGAFSLTLDSPEALTHPAILIPLDPHYRKRSHEATRFVSRVQGGAIPRHLLPVITPVRSLHLIRRLHAYDLYRTGADERRIAAVLIDPRSLTMSLDEWRDHAWRKSARDWRDEGIALVEGGYLRLLTEG